ncbi:MAG TPA: regulatory iron-sulfur-containing complex subunit RicT [Gemmatimonadaceae bacterium]|nr:regulatory iron-sulfur-containing complex subunit RicT [Gemmatimonadaceae bacterium]
MDHLIEIAFKGNRKEFFLWEGEAPPPLRAAVIVDADRGEDLGRIYSTGELAQKRAAGVPHAPGPEGTQKRARRLATAEDVQRHDELRTQDESARRRAMERVKANNLLMKLSDAEWQWDRRKLTIYFTAEKRVDFRNLVRDLAALFRTRIELKQIGVRDEAKRLGGIGRCGREYCSASWLPELRPVNLGVAKDQRLSLNPAQISGACGRLMCCLRYEHEFYVQSRKRFPKEAKVLITARGEEKVVANDIFNERVTLRNVEGETRVVSLADLKREMAGGPMTVEEPVVEEEPDMMMELDEEVIRMTDTAERPAYRPGMRPGMPGFPKPPERPVPLQRRESAGARDQRADGNRESEPPGSGTRDAGDEGKRERGTDPSLRSGQAGNGSNDVSVRQPSSAPAAATSQPPASSAGDESTSMPAANAGAEGARPRRRRGRRGGRRGRGRGDATATPNGGATDATSADATENGGDNGGDEEGDEA